MNYDRLYALRTKFPKAALELDLVSGRVNPETGKVNPDHEPDDLQDLMEYDVLEVLDVIDKQGHSEFSHGYLTSLLIPLLTDRPITPLTGKDWEWGTSCGKDQNRRCSSVFRNEDGTAYNIEGRAFSQDGGKTWWNSRDSWKDISFPCKSKDLETEYVMLGTEEDEIYASKEV